MNAAKVGSRGVKQSKVNKESSLEKRIDVGRSNKECGSSRLRKDRGDEWISKLINILWIKETTEIK